MAYCTRNNNGESIMIGRDCKALQSGYLWIDIKFYGYLYFFLKG